MKKFTILAFALCGILAATAGVPKKATMAMPNKAENNIMEAHAPMSKLDVKQLGEKATVRKAVKLQNETIMDTQAGVSRADGEETTTESTVKLMYANPTGTFFPIMHFVEGGSNYYDNLGRALVPAGKPLTFRNASHYGWDADGYLEYADDQTYTWQYYFGIEDPNYFLGGDTSEGLDLTQTLTSHVVNNNPIYFPDLILGEQSFCPQYTYQTYQRDENGKLITDKNGNYILQDVVEDMSLVAGGNGGLNPGVVEYYNTNGLSNLAFPVVFDNYNAATSVYEFAPTVAAGQATDILYSGMSGKDVRDYYLNKTLTAYGIDPESFYGYAQYFSLGSSDAILSKIAVYNCAVAASAGQSVTLSLYKLVPVGDEAVNLELVYSGDYTFEEDILGYTILDYEMFDEITESEYITLEADTDYMLLLSGIDDLDGFYPTCNQYQCSIDNLTQEWFNRNNIYAAYVSDEYGFFPIPVDFSWSVSGDETGLMREFYPSINFELTLNYPFITPMSYLTSATEGVRPELGATSIDLPFFEYATDNGTLTISQAVVYSDASAEELTASVEWSSEELKESVQLGIFDGNNLQGEYFEFTTNQRIIQMMPVSEIPEGSWIKLHNYGETLTINVLPVELSGIGEVHSNEEAVSTEYYDLQGRRVAADNATGVMIQKQLMPDGSVRTAKVIK